MLPSSPCPAHRRPLRLPAEAYRDGSPFLITICAAGRAPLFAAPSLARLVARRLDRDLFRRGGPVGVWCLMPEHLHLILAGATDVVRWVARFKAATTTAARQAGLISRLWQRRFHDRRLDRTTEALDAATAYVVENPVRRRLVERWEDWPYVRIGWT